jgi:hypothetical protein
LDHHLTLNGEQEEEENQQRGEDKNYNTLVLWGKLKQRRKLINT